MEPVGAVGAAARERRNRCESGALYNQAFEDYIMAPVSDGGLGGTITAAQYPTVPTGVRRITIAGD
jgi:hypothetical protein